ncbi:MAG: rhamnulose-1-phosphate aldolase [Bacilli bacterium]|nr:rhamnulose-1-phosphate aldolase [Bacilli bacterium]
MKKFVDSLFVKQLSEISSNMYRQGWDERNGGNISYLLNEEEIRPYFKEDKAIREINLTFEAPENIREKYFLVTGTGKYFKNIKDDPESNLGLVKICKCGCSAKLLWGFKDGGKFTSEFPAHLMSHSARLSVDPENRVIMHTHPTYTLCMTACVKTDEKEFTRKLWKSNTEAVVVFPEGIGVLPCMICGTEEIGRATAEKLKNFRVVTWTNHGIYGVGKNIDEAFGLIETVEKTAQVYMLTLGHVVNEIPDEVILGLAKLWNLKIMSGVIDKPKN